MSRDSEGTSYDRLIQDYLENEATPAEEEQFRLLLGSESFRRRVAEYSIDLGCLCDQTRLVMLERPHRSRQVIVVAALAASLLVTGTLLLVFRSREPLTPAAEKVETRPPDQPKTQAIVGLITDVTGTVLTANRLESTHRHAVDEGDPLRSGDALYVVGDTGFALLKFEDGSVLAIAGNTELECLIEGSQKRIVVRKGDVMAQVTSQLPGKPMLIETPMAHAEVLGTKLALFASLAITKLAVLEGHVRLKRLSDGKVVHVKEGHTAIASDEPKFAEEPLQPVGSSWEEDFSQNVLANWEHGAWVAEPDSPVSNGAIRAVRCDDREAPTFGQFLVASPRDWWRGLFSIQEDTHLNFTYKVEKAGWFNVMIETRSVDPKPVYSGAFVYRNPSMWNSRVGEWRTVSVPLKFFSGTPGSQVKRGTPKVGHLVFRFYFSSQETDPGLVIDHTWVTRGPSDSAEVLPRWK